MNFLGIPIEIKNLPPLDPGFIPLGAFVKGFLSTAKKPIAIAMYRNDGLVSVYKTKVHGTPGMADADKYYIERLVKFLLWQKGGAEVVIYGDKTLADFASGVYGADGNFDAEMMSRIYEREFTIRAGDIEDIPAENERPIRIGGQMDGCRIGFDAGGSDRKVSAVIDGSAVYSEEVVWHPKTNADPAYHYDGILSAFRTAASFMPRVDAIGVSSAGAYVGNRTMAASLFLSVPKELFDSHVKDIYIRAAKAIGDVPLVVANDGDVTALAGAMELKENNILGIAMGTSQAGGYIDGDGNITGWLNELAFVPVDCQPDAMVDEWSGDKGCGVKYFSQDGVIKLAPRAGIALDENASPAEKLKTVQALTEKGDAGAKQIFESIGVYLAHTLPLYAMFYDMKHVLLLGRVMSGDGGAAIVDTAKRVLAEEYPGLDLNLHLPDENSRRVGQSVAAASLPAVE
ncbi:MAG: ROK family protein [Defluviitaleaceae bacterium]|nr:ROK family protein [Defluviitaleaceae bacterium]